MLHFNQSWMFAHRTNAFNLLKKYNSIGYNTVKNTIIETSHRWTKYYFIILENCDKIKKKNHNIIIIKIIDARKWEAS